MADPVVKVVVDCSVPDRDAVVAYTQDQVAAVLKQRSDGKITSEQAAEKLVALADMAADAAGIPDRVTIVPLDADELAQRKVDQEAHAARVADEAAVAAERQALVGKLSTGKATGAEIQQALAQLLG